MIVINPIKIFSSPFCFSGIKQTSTPGFKDGMTAQQSSLEDNFSKSKELISLQKALSFAEKKFNGKFRKGTKEKIPYMVHCKNVGKQLLEANMPIETIIAGILHDTIEDTPTSYKELEKEFSQNVADLVREVTHKKDPAMSWDEKQTSYLEHVKNASSQAQAISACDKIDNMNSTLEDIDAYKNLKAPPKKQIEKWKRLWDEIYQKSDIPESIKENYKITFNTLNHMTKQYCLKNGLQPPEQEEIV